MNKMIPACLALAALALNLPAAADSRFGGVAPAYEHRDHDRGHYDDRSAHRDRRATRYEQYRRYRDSMHLRRYRDAYSDRSRWSSRYGAYYRDRYDRYSRHDRRRYRSRHGLRLGDGLYLSPHGLTLHFGFDRRDD